MIKIDTSDLIPAIITGIVMLGTLVLFYSAAKEFLKKKGEKDSVGATRRQEELIGRRKK